MTIKYSIDFISDLDAIESIYRDVLLIPDSGKKIIAEILNVCDSIGVFPLIGIDLNSMIEIENDYRYVVCSNYLLFYRIEDDVPIMTRALDGRMDYLKTLFDTRE